MSTPILSNVSLGSNLFEIVVLAPQIAQAAQAGQFAIVMATPDGERIPLTLADWDRQAGTVTFVIMALGTSTKKICSLQAGESLHALAAPLGRPSEIPHSGHVVFAAGGVGTAPVFPIAKACHAAGLKVTVIQAARNAGMLFWEERIASVSHRQILVTDDGSRGEKGLVTAPLGRIIAEESDVSCVVAIGPAPMMRACSETTRQSGVPTVVSLNTIMIDGTGMCGGCRVSVGGELRFACVDGPEFDGHRVDWNSVMQRQKAYHREEKCSLERYADSAWGKG